jgi:hypothetical protein
MRVTEVEIGASMTVPSGSVHFGNVKPSVSMRAEVQPGEHPVEVAAKLREEVETLLVRHAERLLALLRNMDRN